jgi:hypothetical protein
VCVVDQLLVDFPRSSFPTITSLVIARIQLSGTTVRGGIVQAINAALVAIADLFLGMSHISFDNYPARYVVLKKNSHDYLLCKASKPPPPHAKK